MKGGFTSRARKGSGASSPSLGPVLGLGEAAGPPSRTRAPCRPVGTSLPPGLPPRGSGGGPPPPRGARGRPEQGCRPEGPGHRAPTLPSERVGGLTRGGGLTGSVQALCAVTGDGAGPRVGGGDRGSHADGGHSLPEEGADAWARAALDARVPGPWRGRPRSQGAAGSGGSPGGEECVCHRTHCGPRPRCGHGAHSACCVLVPRGAGARPPAGPSPRPSSGRLLSPGRAAQG